MSQSQHQRGWSTGTGHSSSISHNGSNFSSQNQTDTDTEADSECSFGRRINHVGKTELLPRIQDSELILFHPPNFSNLGTGSGLSRTQRRRRVRQLRHTDTQNLRALYNSELKHDEEESIVLKRISSSRNVNKVFEIVRNHVRDPELVAHSGSKGKRPKRRIQKIRGSAWKLRFGADRDRFFESPHSPTKNRSSKPVTQKGTSRKSRAQHQWLRLRMAHKAGIAFRGPKRRTKRSLMPKSDNNMKTVHEEEGGDAELGDGRSDNTSSINVSTKRSRQRRSSIAKGVEYIQHLIQKRAQKIETASNSQVINTSKSKIDSNEEGTSVLSSLSVSGTQKPSGGRWTMLKTLIAKGKVTPHVVEETDTTEDQQKTPIQSRIQPSRYTIHRNRTKPSAQLDSVVGENLKIKTVDGSTLMHNIGRTGRSNGLQENSQGSNGSYDNEVEHDVSAEKVDCVQSKVNVNSIEQPKKGRDDNGIDSDTKGITAKQKTKETKLGVEESIQRLRSKSIITTPLRKPSVEITTSDRMNFKFSGSFKLSRRSIIGDKTVPLEVKNKTMDSGTAGNEKRHSMLKQFQLTVHRAATISNLRNSEAQETGIRHAVSSRAVKEIESNGFTFDLCKERAVATKCSESKKQKKERILKEMKRTLLSGSSSNSIRSSIGSD